jgi:hypothetical protein
VNGAGQPVVWLSDPVPYNPDREDSARSAMRRRWRTSRQRRSLDRRTHFERLAHCRHAAFRRRHGRQLRAVSVLVLGRLEPHHLRRGRQHHRRSLRVGANNSILGFAAPACVTYVPPEIAEGYS